MGCFSYKCKECGKGVKSNSFSGEDVVIFLLEDGKVIERMEGPYDSYGGCFIRGTRDESYKEFHDIPIPEKFEWLTPEEKIDELQFKDYKLLGERAWGDHETPNGFAYVHTKCLKQIPTTTSLRDPNQGWGEEGEFFADTNPEAVYE